MFERNGVDVACYWPHRTTQRPELDGYVLTRRKCTRNYNWKTFIEVYLRTTMSPLPPRFGPLCHSDTHSSAHTTRCRPWAWLTAGKADATGGSPVYERWQKALLDFRGGVPPKQGAIWLTYYPHIMVEWYPHVLTVSTLHPMGVNKTMNMVEFYYPEEIAAFEREFVEAQQAAYMETCIEDDEIGERMDAGRAALFARGDNEVGLTRAPWKMVCSNLHEWYQRRWAPFSASADGPGVVFACHHGGGHQVRFQQLWHV